MCHFWAANLHFAGHDAQNLAGHAQALPGTPLMPQNLVLKPWSLKKDFKMDSEFHKIAWNKKWDTDVPDCPNLPATLSFLEDLVTADAFK